MKLTHEYLEEKPDSVIRSVSSHHILDKITSPVSPIVACCPEKGSTPDSDGCSFPQHPHAWLLESRTT
jgi:hypothetical protein